MHSAEAQGAPGVVGSLSFAAMSAAVVVDRSPRGTRVTGKDDAMSDFRPETLAAISAVRDALELAANGTGDVHAKLGRDVVTDTDVAVEDQLRHAIARDVAMPVIGEERGGDVPSDGSYWLVDPICGTRNFASGIPLFAVNAAMVEGGQVAVAVVGDGSGGDVLVAERGKGAWRLRGDATEPLSTSRASMVVDFGAFPAAGPARAVAAESVAAAIRADRWDIRSFATTLGLAYLAAGMLAGYVLFRSPGAVHIAAGSLLVTEAGGYLTDAAGIAWTPDARTLVGGADQDVHRELLALVSGDA